MRKADLLTKRSVWRSQKEEPFIVNSERASLGVALAFALVAAPGWAQDSVPVRFHETWVEARQQALPVEDARAMLAHIFRQLPDRVTVWPTENYYYFSFSADGRDFGGNFRLHPEERDEGLINFAYFDTGDPSWFRHLLLGEADGVTVRRLSNLNYEVTVEGRPVVFALNPISQDNPGPPLVLSGESFVGRSFDESGLVFLLVFNPAANGFIWVLDEPQPADTPLAPMSPDLEVHVVSGFVFHRLLGEARRILVGVDVAQVTRNTYFDGPFDQLPDNWLTSTRFRELAETADPALRGLINDRGEFASGNSRLAVTPYHQYATLAELWEFVKNCTGSSVESGQQLACLGQSGP